MIVNQAKQSKRKRWSLRSSRLIGAGWGFSRCSLSPKHLVDLLSLLFYNTHLLFNNWLVRCTVRLSVRTLPFHGRKRGSIPLPCTISKRITADFASMSRIPKSALEIGCSAFRYGKRCERKRLVSTPIARGLYHPSPLEVRQRTRSPDSWSYLWIRGDAHQIAGTDH